MNHAVVNDSHVVRNMSLSQESTKLISFQILQHYLSSPLLVPITLNHFKMLARLGRAPVRVSRNHVLLSAQHPFVIRTTSYFVPFEKAPNFSSLMTTT